MDNIFQKISKVMEDVKYLAKDDMVVTNTRTGAGYKAITEEKVTTAVREALIRHGIVIVPIEQTHTRTDEVLQDYQGNQKVSRLATVDVKYRIQNIEDKEDYIIATSSGTGVDTQDKAVGKAMTYSYKYLLLRTFAIPTGEDTDKISSDVYSEQFTAKAPKRTRTTKATSGKISTEQANALRQIIREKGEDSYFKVREVLDSYNYETLEDIGTDKFEEVSTKINSL